MSLRNQSSPSSKSASSARRASLALALLTSACGSTAVDPAIADVDRDGVTVRDGDCDDFNNRVFPAAPEVPGDAIDQDCSGMDAMAPLPTDVDGDGVAAAMGDCNDLDASVFPEARERTGDGVDANCDGEERPTLGEDRFGEAVGLIDTDRDGAISFDEFELACAESAMVLGEARPGVVSTHASCAATNSCRGMMLHPWGELFEHDCRAINTCTGWSCVETAVDGGRSAEVVFSEAGCANCHSGDGGAFKVEVPPGITVEEGLARFRGLSERRMRSSISFGISGLTARENPSQNMPPHFEALSRRELDTLVVWLRSVTLQGVNYQPGDEQGPARPE